MKASCFIAFAITIATFVSVQGLLDRCTSTSSTSSKGCTTDNPACCEHRRRCAVLYNLAAKWETELEISTNPTFYTCKNQCQRHFQKCVRKCRCLSYTNETRSAGPCKCVRSPDISSKTVFTDCKDQCRRARRVCRIGCFGALDSQKCLLKAATKIEWTGDYRGKCQRICKPQIGVRELCNAKVEAA